jgi:hypothetical protein
MFVVFITAVPILAPISIGYYKAVPGGGGGGTMEDTRDYEPRPVCVCVFITAGPSTKLFAWGGTWEYTRGLGWRMH